MSKVYPIGIIGGGSAGVMATLRSVLNNDETIFFPGTRRDKKRSRERWVMKVENMPGHLNYKRGIVEPNKESLEWLSEGVFKEKFHWMKDLGIKKIQTKDDLFELTDSEENKYLCEHVILCTGVMDVQPHIQESIKDILPFANKQTADYCLRCDGHHVYGKEVSVIGHTSSAAWVAVMLYERYKVPNMMILTNGEKPDFSEDLKKLIDLYKIDVYEEKIDQILGDVRSGKLDGYILCCGTSVHTDITFISLGMIVYNELAKQVEAKLDERGFVLGNSKGETNIQNFYVAGDLRANTKKQIYTAWDTAVDAADDINVKIRKKKRERLLKQYE